MSKLELARLDEVFACGSAFWVRQVAESRRQECHFCHQGSKAMGKLKLDDDELVELTGLRQKNRQIEQLRKMRVPYFVNAQGYPVVIREQLLMKAEPETRTEPDWSAIGGARPTRRGS